MHEADRSGLRLAVVVLSWNRAELTLRCLRSVKPLLAPDACLVLVDNGSVDDTVPRVREEFGDEVVILANGTNLGYAGGNNVGLRWALNAGAEYALILNNDTVATDAHFMDTLRAVLDGDATVGLASPLIRRSDGAIWYAGARLNLTSGWRHERKPLQGVRATGYASGCCSLVSARMMRAIGLLREDYFLNVEDVEWSERARRCGWRVVVVGDAEVVHDVGGSQGAASWGRTNSPVAVFYTVRNTMWFVAEYGTWWQRWCIWPLRLLAAGLVHLAGYTVRGRWDKLSAYVRGLMAGMDRVPASRPLRP